MTLHITSRLISAHPVLVGHCVRVLLHTRTSDSFLHVTRSSSVRDEMSFRPTPCGDVKISARIPSQTMCTFIWLIGFPLEYLGQIRRAEIHPTRQQNVLKKRFPFAALQSQNIKSIISRQPCYSMPCHNELHEVYVVSDFIWCELFVALHNRPRGVAVSASGYQPRVFGFESRMILVVPLHGDRRMTQEQNLCVTRTCGLVEGSVQSQALLPRRASIEVQTLDIARPGTILNSQCLELSPRNPQTEERTWASGLVCPRVCTPCIQVVFIYWWGNVWSMASGTPPVTSKEASSLDEYQTSKTGSSIEQLTTSGNTSSLVVKTSLASVQELKKCTVDREDRGYIEFCDSTCHTIRVTEVLPYERIEESYLCDMTCAVYNFRKGDVVAVLPRPPPPFRAPHHPPQPFTTPQSPPNSQSHQRTRRQCHLSTHRNSRPPTRHQSTHSQMIFIYNVSFAASLVAIMSFKCEGSYAKLSNLIRHKHQCHQTPPNPDHQDDCWDEEVFCSALDQIEKEEYNRVKCLNELEKNKSYNVVLSKEASN
uniref:Uncharacterized protein n=1 Tax=Timema tahoe TaxID=61484 RepID=A0A7R9IPE2_9NEOP|nr:unnamed protein product [Timema tahoe]